MTDTFDGEDLLYNLAYECEAHFDQLQDTLRKTKSPDGIVQVCGEFQQRFAIWAAHIGVFARKSQCLDTRLQNLPDLQDLVARLLDILRRSLQQCTVEPPSQGGNDEIMVDTHEFPLGPQIQTAALKTIDDTLTRLNRLGVTIRQSGRGKLDTRVKRFASGLDLSSFARLCAEAVQALYPGAHQSLRDRLSKSMTDRYARMLFLDSRHQKLQTRRELPIGLSPIDEVPASEMQTNTPHPQLTIGIRNRAINKLSRPSPAFSQSDLSSVNLQQIKSRLRAPDEASTKLHKTSSIQINQGNYPHIPAATQSSGVFTCQWCSELLSKKTLSESEWRRHIDRDLKPYICLSEACPEAHPAYATFDEWCRHMELHDRRWHQHIYLASSWVCTICELSSDTYSSPQALYLHLEESHGTEFSHPQLQAISRQSKTEQPRASNDCLLCCFAMEAQGNIDEALFPKRRKGQTKQQASKSARKTLEMGHPGPHNSDSELSDTSSDSDNMGSAHGKERSKSRSKAVSRHVAVHLQGLMLLTLRFAAALQDIDGDVDDGTKSDSVDIDEGNSASDGTDLGRLSHGASEDDVTMNDDSDKGNGEGDVGLDESLSDDITTDDIPVPDSDIDLEYIPRRYDNLAVEDDEFLKEVIESGDFLSWEDIPKEFSIARGVMTAARVALAPVPSVINGVSFDFFKDANGDGDSNAVLSHISDSVNDTSYDSIATERLPDGLDKRIRPNGDDSGAKRQEAHLTTMGDAPDDNEEENVEGDRIALGITIHDQIVGRGRIVRYGDTVIADWVLRAEGAPEQRGYDVGKPRPPDSALHGNWDLGIIGMRVGGKRRLTLPAHLASGSNHFAGVPAESRLICDIRLLEILNGSMFKDDSSSSKPSLELESLNEPAESKLDHLQSKHIDRLGVDVSELPPSGPDMATVEESGRSLPKKSEYLESAVGTKTASASEDPKALNTELIHTPEHHLPGLVAADTSYKSSDPVEMSDPYEGLLPEPILRATSRPNPTRPTQLALETQYNPTPSEVFNLDTPIARRVDLHSFDSKWNSFNEPHFDDQFDTHNFVFDRVDQSSPPQSISSLFVESEDVSQEANDGPQPSIRSRHDADTPAYESADAEEDSPPRLRRVGHVHFDEFAETRTSFPSFSDEAMHHPFVPSPDDETTNDEIMTLPRRSAKPREPSSLPRNLLDGEREALEVHEDNGEKCTYPDCGRTFKDLEAHMITHQIERPEKCPIMTCEYYVKGFARKYDRSCHLLSHYKGTLYCGFCPGSGSADQKSFNCVASFKRHLTAVHGVEPLPPPNSRWSSVAYRQKWLASYAPDATGKCSTCSQTFTTAQDLYMHLDDCVLRIIRQDNLPNFDENSGERLQRLYSLDSEPREGDDAAPAQLRPHDDDNSGEVTDLLGEKGPGIHPSTDKHDPSFCGALFIPLASLDAAEVRYPGWVMRNTSRQIKAPRRP